MQVFGTNHSWLVYAHTPSRWCQVGPANHLLPTAEQIVWVPSNVLGYARLVSPPVGAFVHRKLTHSHILTQHTFTHTHITHSHTLTQHITYTFEFITTTTPNHNLVYAHNTHTCLYTRTHTHTNPHHFVQRVWEVFSLCGELVFVSNALLLTVNGFKFSINKSLVTERIIYHNKVISCK